MNKNSSQKWLLGSLIASIFASCLVSQAAAQSASDRYPDKPIKIIVPLAAGGVVDFVARVIGQKIQDRRDQPVIIESRPGASTLIGATAAAKSPADGYTLIVSVRNHTTNPAMRTKMSYNTLKVNTRRSS